MSKTQVNMSNLKPKPAAEINLEEFERRLRAAAAPQAGVEDPLAELTRLVDTIGFERTPSERALEATRAPKLALKAPALRTTPALRAPPPPPAPVAPLAPVTPPAPKMPPSVEDSFDPESAFAAEANPTLRPSFDEVDDADAFAPPPPSREEVVEPLVEAPSARSAKPRGRHWGLKVGGLVAASVVMIGAVAVFKVGRSSHSGAPPLILAATAPTKVAPPSEETVRTANETGNLLTRDTAQPTATPPKLVAPPEAPVDLAARPQPTASPAATSDASPVAPASETPIVASPVARATPAAPVGGDPSRVKTISVRPDGTLISSGFEANAPAATPAPAPAPAPIPAKTVADAEAATPAPALPTKLSPPKSAARVVSKTDTTAPADTGAGPVPVKPRKLKPTPTAAPVAEAEPKTDDAAPAEAAPAPSGGGYAVQLAAPRSQADADALMKSLPGRYASALSGASLGVRKADRNGETIYRVRAMGLSRSEANAMCAKIKSSGGDCYVAKN